MLSRTGVPLRWAWGTACLAIAFALRASRWGEGLPAFLDEAMPLRLALRMWRDEGFVDWNPHFFVYPSLPIYLQFAVQWAHLQAGTLLGAYPALADFLLAFMTDPTRHVVIARAFGTVLDLAAVLGTVVLGERLARGAGIAAGFVVALSPNSIDTARALYVEAPLAVATVWSLERMVVHLRRGDRRSLAAAAVLVGLATACKYPGALLAVPLAATALLGARGRAGIASAVAALAVVAAVFAATSPFVLLDWSRAAEDLQFTTALARRGHLGNLERVAAGFYATQLARDPGALVLGLAVLAPLLAWKEAALRREIGVLALAILPLLASVSLSSVLAARYLISIVPLLAVCGAVAGVRLALRVPWLAPGARRAVVIGVVAASVAPAAWSAWTRPARDTRLEALAWCSATLPPDAVVLQESGGPPLLPVTRYEAVIESPMFVGASTPARTRFRALRAFNVVAWPLFVHGDLSVNRAPPGAPPLWVEVMREASDFNAAFYHLALVAHADYVVTSSVVRGRYEADTIRYAAQARVYRALDREAEHVARFHPDRERAGPRIDVYRIPASTRARWLEEHGPWHPDAWLAVVPPTAAIRREGAAGLLPNGRPAWAAGLSPFHARHVEPTVAVLADAVGRSGRIREAVELARARDAWRGRD